MPLKPTLIEHIHALIKILTDIRVSKAYPELPSQLRTARRVAQIRLQLVYATSVARNWKSAPCTASQTSGPAFAIIIINILVATSLHDFS